MSQSSFGARNAAQRKPVGYAGAVRSVIRVVSGLSRDFDNEVSQPLVFAPACFLQGQRHNKPPYISDPYLSYRSDNVC
jgi:hypothetical protein